MEPVSTGSGAGTAHVFSFQLIRVDGTGMGAPHSVPRTRKFIALWRRAMQFSAASSSTSGPTGSFFVCCEQIPSLEHQTTSPSNIPYGRPCILRTVYATRRWCMFNPNQIRLITATQDSKVHHPFTQKALNPGLGV